MNTITTSVAAESGHATVAPSAPVSVEAVMHQFFTPRRMPAAVWPAEDQPVTLTVSAPADWPDGRTIEVVCHRMGTGPAVLLVHGWQSQAADLKGLAKALLAQGYSVWAPDLPGHGHSAGRMLSIPLAAQTLCEIEHLAGPFHAAVGHSIGAACVVQGLVQGLATPRVVLIATPTHYGQHARLMADGMGLPAAQWPALLARMEQVTGVAPDAIDMQQQARRLTQRACLIHALDDAIVPLQPALRVAEHWAGAQWHGLQGLGHFDIVADAQVHQLVLQALAAPAP